MGLDERLVVSYLRPMAKRLMLTLLALLTGLFAQIGPAQAQPCAAGASQIGIIAPVESATCRNAAVDPRIHQPRPSTPGEVARFPAGDITPPQPAVLIGIDRARE